MFLMQIVTLCDGAILVIAFFPPLATRFEPGSPNTALNSDAHEARAG
jgi:hypothetical protein